MVALILLMILLVFILVAIITKFAKQENHAIAPTVMINKILAELEKYVANSHKIAV
jgi:uncharacterized membrane protein YoaK (UPF0700 family)